MKQKSKSNKSKHHFLGSYYDFSCEIQVLGRELYYIQNIPCGKQFDYEKMFKNTMLELDRVSYVENKSL